MHKLNFIVQFVSTKSIRALYTGQLATVRSVWPQLGRGTPWHRPCSPLSHL